MLDDGKIKKYSIWVEKTGKHKYKFSQRYVDPLRSTVGHIVRRKVSVTLTKKTAQARREAAAILDRKIRRKLQEQSTGTDTTLQDLTDAYLAYLKETDRPFSTRTTYTSDLDKWVDYFGSDVVADRITSAMVTVCLEDLLYKHDLSNQTVKQKKVALSDAFNYGIRHGMVKHNPAINLKVSYKDETLKKKERIENKYLTDEEAEALLDQIKDDHRPDYYDLCKFMLLTGMRFNEAAGLTKQNIKQDDGMWVAEITGSTSYRTGKIYKQDGGKRFVKSDRDKTPAGLREVVLNDEALSICRRNITKNRDLIFTNSRTGKEWISMTFDRYIAKTSQDLKMSKRVTSHFFRHTYISKLVELGVPLNVIMAQVGQQDSDVTRKIYTHVTKNEKQSLRSKLSQLQL